jgi:hypothetical protein
MSRRNGEVRLYVDIRAFAIEPGKVRTVLANQPVGTERGRRGCPGSRTSSCKDEKGRRIYAARLGPADALSVRFFTGLETFSSWRSGLAGAI